MNQKVTDKLPANNPLPLLSAYRMGDQIMVQFGPMITDQTACMLQVVGALVGMAHNNVMAEHQKDKPRVLRAGPGVRVPRVD